MASKAISSDVARAVAAFWHRGAGPSHGVITQELTAAGLSDGYVYDPAGGGPNKEDRVFNALRKSQHQGQGRKLLEGLLSALRHAGLVGGSSDEDSENVQRLREALERDGLTLNQQGQLRAVDALDLDTGGRAALEETMDRLRNSTTDPALLIGTAKDLLESVAKFVLEELGMPVSDKQTFAELWHIARERLGVLPQNVDTSLPGYAEIRKIHQSSWEIASNVNALRNLQGTGHGRTLPTGVTEELAQLVVREACSVAEYMLRVLDKEQGH